jgi:glutamate-5-semialdehyde dehydrogenase
MNTDLHSDNMESVESTMMSMGKAARRAATALALASADSRDQALQAIADAIRGNKANIMDANKIDIASAVKRGLAASLLDRLELDDQRIESMASGIESIIALADPLGRILARWQQPNGLSIERVSVPLGVIGIIYESRPNVTSDAAGLCLKSGNAVILRGGSESFHSSHAIFSCLQSGLCGSGIDAAVVQMIPTTDRAAVGFLLSSMSDYVDVVVPRGGKSLIKRVQQEARVPVIGHLEGVCHVYLHASASTAMATAITHNAKMRRTGICGAAETLLVDRDAAERLLPPVCAALIDAGCEVRGDETVVSLVAAAKPATEDDWYAEYLDSIIAVRVVDDIDGAMTHIRQFGSGHTESIVASDRNVAERFLHELDSAILLHNASTQYADGGEFGMGAEIGIATGRVHARGPVGAEQLTSYKYVVRGDGQVRP